MRIAQECGQRWYRPRSWRRDRSCDNVLRFRRFPEGFAFGPIMLFRSR